MIARHRWLALALFAAAAAPLNAQEPDPADAGGGSLIGIVLDTRGATLPDAEIVVPGRGVVARTNLRGEFRATGLPTSDLIVFVRHLGHAPVLYSVTPRATAVRPDTVALEPVALPLETLEVAELRGTQAGLARRLATGQSSILSSERLAQFPTIRDALDATLPAALGGSRGCLLQGMNGAAPTVPVRGRSVTNGGRVATTADTPALFAAAVASTINSRTVYPNALTYDFWATGPSGTYLGSNGLGHIELGITSSGASITMPGLIVSRPADRSTGIAPGDLLALELIPAEHVAAHFPGVRDGCSVIQLWQ